MTWLIFAAFVIGFVLIVSLLVQLISEAREAHHEARDRQPPWLR